MRFIFSLFFIIFLSSTFLAQSYDVKPLQTDQSAVVKTAAPALQGAQSLSFISTPKQADIDFKPNIRAAKSPNLSKDHSVMKIKKEQATTNKREGIFVEGSEGIAQPRSTSFDVTNGFFTDLNGGCPNDNTIAISSSGKIISMMNGMVGIYNNNGAHINSYQLDNFFNNFVTSSCDPKVEYDPNADRFFMFVQSCGEPFDYVAFGFSTSNDPNGSWNIYLFDSDIFGNNNMSDYPKIAITRDEVFVSLRLFDKSSSNYTETICYQMNKNNGYNGDNLQYLIWNGLPFSTAPVRSGSGQYGPGVYLLHSESGGGSSLTFMDITNNIGSNPTIKTSNISVPRYDVPGSAYQPSSNNQLDSGDSRMQDAYYQDGMVHCVFTTSIDQWAGVRYHRLDVTNLDGQNYSEIHHVGTKDYTYPSITPFTLDSKNQTSLVHFQATGSNDYPEMRAKIFNHDFTFESSQVIHQGNAPMEYCYDQNRGYARWGDYTEVAIDYSSSLPTVWVTGSVAYSSSQVWNTYLAELTANSIPTSTKELQDSEVKLFPNPTTERINIYLDVNDQQEVSFQLIDANARVVSHLFSGSLYAGSNEFSFDVSTLQSGVYYVSILNNESKIIKNEKVIVHH